MNTLIKKKDSTLFDVGFNQNEKKRPFERQLPVFNWFYPFSNEEDLITEPIKLLSTYNWSSVGRASAYFHIPFCETICSFCPFTRGLYKLDEEVEEYLKSLIKELQLKRSLIGIISVDSIFIGGGTPSVLSPNQILFLGKNIHTYLDTSKVVEFAVEVEVKSVTLEKLKAFKKIGVNRISFGVQTFSKIHRDAMNLDATIDQITQVAKWTNKLFEYTNIDIIYGQAGQSVENVINDAQKAISLKTTSVDFYPLNNVAAQVKMHKAFDKLGLSKPNAMERLKQRLAIAEFMISKGYSRINGYSFALKNSTNTKLMQAKPKFLYHDILYGFNNDAIIGYGASAHSQILGFNFYNSSNRKEYMRVLGIHNMLPIIIRKVEKKVEKGIVTFPYRGTILKSELENELPSKETRKKIQNLIDAELINDRLDCIELTELGWLYYVNIMYYLMPIHGKKWISNRINTRIKEKRFAEETALS